MRRPPGLVLTIFLALLPMLLTFMNKRAGMQSKAEIDFAVFHRFFIFQASDRQCNAECRFYRYFDRLPGQFCRLPDRLSDHLALQWW